MLYFLSHIAHITTTFMTTTIYLHLHHLHPLEWMGLKLKGENKTLESLLIISSFNNKSNNLYKSYS